MGRNFSDRGLVIAATIVGASIVCAARIVAKNPFEFFMSPLFARSIQKQFVAQVKSQLSSHPRQDPWGLGQGKKVWLQDVSVSSIGYEELSGEKDIRIEYVMRFKPTNSYRGSCWLTLRGGHYIGHAPYGFEPCGGLDQCEQSAPLDIH